MACDRRGDIAGGKSTTVCAHSFRDSLARIRRVVIAAAVAIGWASIAAPALGAPATPDPGPAVICDAPARSREEIDDLLADPDIATPAATTGGQTIPEGRPADAVTAAAMEGVVRLWLACQNAGESFRAWSLFSDGYLYRLLLRQGMPEDPDSAGATPGANVDGGARLLEIRGQRMLPDGRFGATVTVAYPSVPMPKTFFFFFTEIAGRLLIDGILGEISFSVP